MPIFLLFAIVLMVANPVQAYQSPGNICTRMIAHVEQQQQIPKNLLNSIALTESGRRDPVNKQYSAWPWTIMAEGKGRYFDTKAEAVKAAKRLRARGIKNIDVGCMQINYGYHNKHFGGDITRMFDPYLNVNYSAKFLNRLKAESGLWSKAVGNYHSRTPSRSKWYQQKVFAKWRGQHNTKSPTVVRGGRIRTASNTARRSPVRQVNHNFTRSERMQLAANSKNLLDQRRVRQLKVIAYD